MGPVAWWRRLVVRWRTDSRFQDVTTAAGTFVVGSGLNALGLTGLLTGFEVTGVEPASWWHTVLLAAACGPMLVKRRWPVPTLLAALPFVVADLLIGGSVAIVLVLFDLLFAAGMFASPRARAAVMTAVVVVIGTGSVLAGLAVADLRMTVLTAVQLAGLLVIPLWWAGNVRQQRELGELNAQRARLDAIRDERSAMARELHDVIASHLSTTAIHSGAALALPADAGRDRAALREVRESSLAALREMRSMITLLRADTSEDAAVPAGLERLPELVDVARRTGLDVTVDADLPPDVPPLVDHAGYRIVREALTNAGKHAPGSRVLVSVASGDRLDVTITNTLTRSAPLGSDALSAGTGLSTMAERAALAGGKVSAGPDADVWRVSLTLPLDRPEPGS